MIETYIPNKSENELFSVPENENPTIEFTIEQKWLFIIFLCIDTVHDFKQKYEPLMIITINQLLSEIKNDLLHKNKKNQTIFQEVLKNLYEEITIPGIGSEVKNNFLRMKSSKEKRIFTI